MRLSAIRLAGFKSFVDRSQLSLTSNLTAVVGPNGCGKSNLIDAVRWVLGESSAKQLRGAALSDVIFNGSRTRKPVGRAMIELVFDNTDASVDGPYAQYGEIAVRRELSRDGGSQFYINGTRCRRKDVTDLFLGTGLGARSNYAIIEQGTISRLIEAQPDDMRQMLEESAGISRYKEKRRETEIRIRHTRENLERLEDLLGEIDERLAKLQRQAKAAERFKRYKQEQRDLRKQLLALRWQQLQREQQQQQDRLNERRARAAQTEAQLKDAMVASSERNAEAEQAMGHTQEAQARFYEAQGQLSQAEQEHKHARDMLALRDQEASGLRQEAQRLKDELERRSGKAEDIALQLEQLRQSAESVQQQLVALETDEQAADDQAQTSAAALEQTRQALQQPRTVTATEKVRLEQISRQLQAAQSREQSASRELAEIDLDGITRQQSAAEQACLAAARALEEADEAAAQRVIALERCRESRQHADQGLHEARKQAQSVHARLATLQAEQQRALGQDDKAQQAWLAQHGWAKADVLGRLLEVPERWMGAVEAVLGAWLQAPCLDADLLAIPATEQAPPRLISLRANAQQDPPDDSLGALVKGPAAIRQWLATVRAVDDSAGLQAVLDSAPPGTLVVTPEGQLHWAGMRRIARDDAQAGILLREQLVTQAQEDDAATREGLRQAEQAHTQAQADLKSAEQAHQEGMKALDQARRQSAEAKSALQALAARQQSLAQRQAERQKDRDEALRLSQELAEERDAASQALEESQAALVQLEDEEKQRQQQAEQARAELQRLRQQRDALSRQLARDRERRAALDSEMAAIAAARESLAGRLSDIEQRLSQSEQARDESEQPLEALERAMGAAKAALDSARQELESVRKRQDEATQRARAAADGVLKAEQASQAARDAVQQEQLGEQRLLARRDGLEEQFREQGLRAVDLTGALRDDLDISGCEEQLQQLEQRIGRLGAVNLAAVEEYEEEHQRAETLRTQEADLTAALDKLDEAIRQIDKETRARFRATFEAVNERFKARFPKLFGGGEAYLELTGDDVLDAGVRVMARPPGKRNASIQLLSGGEKALTAVSLVFALFELNPAPFCMLDEVDAPLDDANVVRFCEVVREMSASVQFILVTHNKVTMELAEQLNGVTMQEAGVSRLVSVDVQQAVEMAV